MLNLNYTLNHFRLDFTEIFLASVDEGTNLMEIEEELSKVEEFKFINPNPINRKFIGLFVGKYLPFPRAILLFSGIVSFFISIILVVLVTDFILTKRKGEYALLIAIGGTKSKINQIIMTELMILSVTSLVVSILLGYLIAYVSILFFIPFTLKKLVVPLSLSFNFQIVLSLFLLIIFELIVLISLRRKKILHDNIINILLKRED